MSSFDGVAANEYSERSSQEGQYQGPLPDSNSCGSFRLLLLQFMAQLRETQHARIMRCEEETYQERERCSAERNSTLEAEHKVLNEMLTLRLQAKELLEQKMELERLLSKAVQEVQGREGEIKRLEQFLEDAQRDRRELTQQLQSENMMQMQALMVELRQNLTGSFQQVPSFVRPGSFINGTMNHYVRKIPGTCPEKVSILDAYLKRLPALLVSRTAEVALLEATKLNQIPEMEALIATGLPLDKLTGDSRTYLWWAAHNGHVAASQVLLAHGARINAISPGWISSTALHVAAWMGQIKVVQLLVDNGGDLETKSSEGQTVIFYAARRGQVNIVQYLVDKGADLEARDVNGKSTIEVATAPVAQWFKDRATRQSQSGGIMGLMFSWGMREAKRKFQSD